MGDDMEARCRAVWKLCSEKKPNLAMRQLNREDESDGELVSKTDAEFLQVASDIGAANAKKMDGGAVPDAFRAWCQLFGVHFDSIRGRDGGDWLLLKELTFSVFARVVRGMPSGKAVGEGGFSIELLRAADEWVLRAFYRALLKDLADSTLSSNWWVVLYALLMKPLPKRKTRTSGHPRPSTISLVEGRRLE